MKNFFVIALIFMLVTAISAVICGCSLVDNLQEYKNGEESGDQQTVVQRPLELAADEDKAAASPEQEQTADTEEPRTPGENEVEVLLYFMSDDGSSLESEKRIIPKEEGVAKATVEQLIKGPESSALSATLPETASLRGIDISNGICTVDFASGLLSALSEDPDDQTMAVYSIVNTLSQFSTVDQVKILENGKSIGQVGGVDASAALAPVRQ